MPGVLRRLAGTCLFLLCRRKRLLCRHLFRLAPVRNTLYDVKRDRDQKYRNDRRSEHTADDCRAHDLPSHCTCTGRDRKGQNPEDERKRRHQDRTETQASSGKRRIDN